ncbi:CHASE domain-containing protein [Pseudobowmanella zhangzhouensis]|uniref:CHASE domain-containing protein n=1 Tax=Pseudobowmanella zhangzhouensis TaxID=1537679 RepID=UPI00360EF9A0
MLTIALVILLAFIIDLMLEQVVQQESRNRAELTAYRQLSTIAAKMEGHLSLSLSMLEGFSAYIAANPELSYEEFARYAKEMFKREPLIVNFAAARNLIVNYVYPLEGNEKAVGLDYSTVADQNPSVLKTVRTAESLVIGPVQLVQGGEAFIARSPIFYEQNQQRQLWGIISAPIDADALFRQSDVSLNMGDILAIRSFDALGEREAVFLVKSTFLTNRSACRCLSQSVVVAGNWQFYPITIPISY